MSAVIQLVSVPVFLRFWGPSLYGEWLLLSTVPTYLSLTDMGFGSVAGNDMTMRVAAGDRTGALRSFQSAWVMICVISAVVGAVVAGGVYVLPLRRWLNLAAMSPREFDGVLLLLIVYALGTLQTTLTSSGFRCDGNYATGTLLLNLFRLVEALGSAAAVAFGARPLVVAAFLVAARWSGQLLMCIVMRRRSPWITWGWAHANTASIRDMARPAFAFMAFPLGSALSLQGMLLVVGIVLGPVAVAVFSTTRTLTRIGYMILETVRYSIWPELSMAFGAANWSYARKLHGKACQAALLLCAAAVLFLAVFGRRIYIIWTHGSLTFDPLLFDILLVVVVTDSLWYASSAASIACNAHQRIAGAYLVATTASLVLAYISVSRMGLVGPALALLAIDIPMTRYVLRSSLAVLRDTPYGFLRELCTAPNFRGLAAQIMGKQS
ncbi:MAG: lipopolysaccharide biosynthesis protein [Acidobacteriia bacterium]|nr:lipopolysaccharide biosynthesis protein [Terriglobia bacterium]